MKIGIVGDLVLLNPKETTISTQLQELLNSCDLSLLNFESPLESENAAPIHKSGPNLEQHQSAPEWVKKHGFHLVSLANNHILDSGIQAFFDTEKALEDEGVKTFGAGDLENAYEPFSFVQDGIKVAILAGTHKEFGCHSESSTPHDVGAAWIRSQEFIHAVIKARQTHDKVIIFAHGGVEYLPVPLPEWRAVYKKFIDMGVDAVIASHPHVPQGVEYYKNCPIAYSLGNFIFQKSNPIYKPFWNNGYLAILEVDDQNKPMGLTIVPLTYNPISKIVDIDKSEKAHKHRIELERILMNESDYIAEFGKALREIAPNYWGMYSSAGFYAPKLNTAFAKQLVKTMLGRKPHPIHAYNLFNCESHQWVMEHLLSSKKL